METNLNGIVVKNLSPEMGKIILTCLKLAGYENDEITGENTASNDTRCYYGILNNGIIVLTEDFILRYNKQSLTDPIKIITLDELIKLVSYKEELTFPRNMRVRDNERADFLERLVLDIIPNCLNGIIAVTITDEKNYKNGFPFQVTQWKYAEEINAEPISEEITLEELNKRHKTNYKIVDK